MKIRIDNIGGTEKCQTPSALINPPLPRGRRLLPGNPTALEVSLPLWLAFELRLNLTKSRYFKPNEAYSRIKSADPSASIPKLLGALVPSHLPAFAVNSLPAGHPKNNFKNIAARWKIPTSNLPIYIERCIVAAPGGPTPPNRK
jgi:hypothetical protein